MEPGAGQCAAGAPAARLEAEGIGFRLETDFRRPQKKRRGSSGSVMDCGGGRVLHHFCWVDDPDAMAGTVDHLTCIKKDMRDSVERLGMQYKEKSLAIVAGPYTD